MKGVNDEHGNNASDVTYIKSFLKKRGCNENCAIALADTTKSIEESLKELQVRPEWRNSHCPAKTKCLQELFLYLAKNVGQFV